MFNKKAMSAAIYDVFDLFEPDDFMENDKEVLLNELQDKMETICAALRSEVMIPFEFALEDALAQQFSYRGKELFGQRACLLHYKTNHNVMDIVEVNVDDELWITVHVLEPEYEDLFFAPEDLMESLNDLYEQYDEQNATIYEL